MTALSAFVAAGRALARLAQRAVADQAEFTCGDCDRNARCGLAPHQECVYRLMQIAERRAQPARWPVPAFRYELAASAPPPLSQAGIAKM